jgi:hypothetical protein
VRGRLPILLLTLAASLLLSPSASAQNPQDVIYVFDLSAPQGTRADVPINGNVNLPVTFHDMSKDSATALVPNSPLAPSNLIIHYVNWEVVPRVQDDGWTVFPPSTIFSYAGTSTTVDVNFQVTAQATHDFYPVDLIATVTTADGSRYQQNITLLGFSLGAGSFAAQVTSSYQLKPKEIVDVPIRLTNLGLEPRAFDMEVVDNPCGMATATANNNVVRGKSTDEYTVSLQAPAKKVYYFSESCTVSVAVSPTGRPEVVQVVSISTQVNGLFISQLWIIQAILLILFLVLLFLFLARRKARIEEEILGKPQKPWTIPVEVLYLKALRQKDERAWYVVRHYLMEDEYRSALLWYKSYKKTTKGQRSKEGLVLRQEKGYERWKAAWLREIARPVRQADRFEERLQRRLDRKARKAHGKQMRKYAKVVARMKAAHGAQVERAGKQHAKAAAKAAKKGLPAPKRPVVPEPDYPDEPGLAAIPLATHKWAKKAARFRARRVRKQGDLEVKFEKADARRLAKVRRKVQRLARKLDDPEFVAEHPLLKSS